MKTSILEYLEGSADKYPDKTAFADRDIHPVHLSELEHTAQKNRNCPGRNILLREIRFRFLWKKVWKP